MKIENIQINGFGKLKNKNIKLTDGINIIIGRNESGKSTLLKFINSMIYGISKNKRGKEISDLERYTPWETETYSGKIKYKLDDGKEFEIYRNFKNKELKIYNNFGDDITPLFSVEKNKEIPFFYEQTNVEEDLFLNSTEIIQNQIKIDKVNQNLIIQKLSNLATTGNDNISYKKSIEKLNKKQLEEIGTERSQDRPINKIINKINTLKKEKKELEEYEDKKYEIEKESDLIENKIKELNCTCVCTAHTGILTREEANELIKESFAFMLTHQEHIIDTLKKAEKPMALHEIVKELHGKYYQVYEMAYQIHATTHAQCQYLKAKGILKRVPHNGKLLWSIK